MKYFVLLCVVLVSIAFAQVSSADVGNATDPCAGIVCKDSTLTCPDGYVASCSNTCSNGVCSACTPDCTGHEKKDLCAGVVCPSKSVACPDGSTASCTGTCDPATGMCKECVVSCPEKACLQVITYAVSPEGKCEVFSNSCIPDGWKKVDKCPEATPVPPPTLPTGCKEIKDEATGLVKVVCEVVPTVCPVFSDYDIEKCNAHNGTVSFFVDSRGCKIFECKFQPVVTTTPFMPQPVVCPTEEQRQQTAEKCKAIGGTTVVKKDFSGCLIVDCAVAAVETKVCPPIESLREQKDKCIQVGGKIVPEFDQNGCEVPRCIPPARMCPTEEENKKRVEECEKNGLVIVPAFDNNGCKIIKCMQPGEERPKEACAQPPKEAFEKCNQEGGEMIIKNDEYGCPTYAKCVKRGDERAIQYEEVEEIPKTTVLLSLAFKLEQLKIEFDKLARQTNDIANYYASTGSSNEAERFRKVSSMFEAAKSKIDEIKTKMRERITTLTIEDTADFKHDLKYIREVVIQDILYVMLSTEAAIPKEKVIAEEGYKNCGRDDVCFNKMLRTCEKAIVYPGGAEGPEVIIEGLEDKNCIIKAVMKVGETKYDMICKYPNYVMGLRGPEELMPYCEGPMMEMIKQQHGTTQTQPKEVPSRLPQ